MLLNCPNRLLITAAQGKKYGCIVQKPRFAGRLHSQSGRGSGDPCYEEVLPLAAFRGGRGGPSVMGEVGESVGALLVKAP